MKHAGLVVAACLLCSCGDDGNGPGNVSFPNIDATLLAAVCWQGNLTAPQNGSGTISASDCDAADIDPADEGYFETFRVRVPAARSVTITTNATFDAYLTVVRVNSITGSSANVTVIGEDDDSGPGLNAMVTVSLQPGVDYFISVGGFDYAETGTYSFTMN